MRLRVSRDFFIQFAKRTWLSPYSVVNELVEDAYDEDATRVIVTVSDAYVVVEDDAGMDGNGVGRFLVVGSAHKQQEPFSPRFGRPRTGRYGVGRMSFLAFFDALKVKTRKGAFTACFMIDEDCLAGLASGQSEVKVLEEQPVGRDGSEIWLLRPRSKVSAERILENLRELPILREPYFEVWLRIGEFKPWSHEGAERVKPREIMGERIPVRLVDEEAGEITGEIIVAYRPLTDREKGILVLHGGHAVTRGSFGLSPSELSRVTGCVRCDRITTRFADKAAVIEDEVWERLQKIVRQFLVENVLPKALQVEKGMTYEESRVFLELDRLLSKVIAAEEAEEAQPAPQQPALQPPQLPQQPVPQEANAKPPDEQAPQLQASQQQASQQQASQLQESQQQPASIGQAAPTPEAPRPEALALPPIQLPIRPPLPAKPARPPKPLRREVSLSRLGYKVIPYEDEGDEREFFVEGNVIYINRGHPAYRKELKMGREVLRRHVLRLVASALARGAFSNAEALDYANKLVSEVIARL